jgi:DNA-directed RNA polymerase I subunit RPA1
MDETEGWVEFQISFPASTRRLLMVQLVEKAAANTTIRATKDIMNAYALTAEINGKEVAAVQTEGVNFEAIWALPEELVQFKEIKSNDIHRMLLTYGVEAARQNIVSEVLGVFGVYGIDVNPRHLSLIADFMTRTGSYLPMNRMGMNECSSPFLQMSFETTCNFLTRAAQEGARDTQQSPSARIVVGGVAKVGTGCFDIMLPLEAK